MDNDAAEEGTMLLLIIVVSALTSIRRRQRRRARLLSLVANYQKFNRAVQRRIWRRKRSTVWWTEIVPTFDATTFLENFRMSRETFQYVCDQVAPALAPNPAAIGPAVELERRVAIAIYVLSTTTEFRNIGHLFGVHKSTVHSFYRKFVRALITACLREHIRLPTDEEAATAARRTEARTGFPGVWGALDGTHLPISAPSEGHHDYTNRKGWQSFNMQALVDDRGRFLSVTCMDSGNTHDATVLRRSSLWRLMENNQLPKGTVRFDHLELPLMIAGDPAYPLLPWLMKGYTGPLTDQQRHFNTRLSHARVVVEHCFGRFKGRWRRLLKRSEIDYRFVPAMAYACAILHNIVEGRGDAFNNGWLEVAAADEAQQPPGELYQAPQLGPNPRRAAITREDISDVLWARRA